MTAPKFSIIVPVYNAETTINQTIDTLRKIDSDNFEVLLVNDGSIDHTEKVIKDSIENDPRFLLHTKKNEGPGLARNRGVEEARGDYLLFFDADDLPVATILDDYAKIIYENPSLDLIISSFTFRTLNQDKVVDEKNYLINDYVYSSNKSFLADMYELMNQQLMYVVWNKCYRRDIISANNIRFKNYNSCEDRIFNIEYYKYCHQVVMNSKIEYVYEFEGGRGITNQYKEDKFATFKEFYEQSNLLTNNSNRAGMASLLLKGTTSVIFSILETDSALIKDKKKEISKIFNDQVIRKASKIAEGDTLIKKITKMLYKMPEMVFYYGVKIMYQIQKCSPSLLAKLKRNY